MFDYGMYKTSDHNISDRIIVVTWNVIPRTVKTQTVKRNIEFVTAIARMALEITDCNMTETYSVESKIPERNITNIIIGT